MTHTTTAPRYHADPTGHALYAAVLADPFAVLPRLVYADWLEADAPEAERDAERVEVIRLQFDEVWGAECERTAYPLEIMPDVAVRCLDYITGKDEPQERWCRPCRMRHWVMQVIETHDTEIERHVLRPFVGNGWTAYAVHQWAAGFVEEVRCTLGWWLGGECETCADNEAYYNTPGQERDAPCPRCRGNGVIPGHRATTSAPWPVTRVVVTDREPARTLNGRWTWHQTADWDSRYRDLGQLHEVPPGVAVGVWDTREAAETALSRALVDAARAGAGLPPIHWEG